ncbi:MAG TPA: glycoside hydrolase family 127 protein, partial [Lacipirellulaceae bacterium]|nr:glycoside hydrolase family 127 protein [Lacipirellulaceae bacterium]
MKHWIVLLALLISCAQAFAQENRPTATARPLEIGAARWTDGFWADRLAVCRQRSHPAMWEIMRGDQYKPFLLHFQIAAGQRDGDYHGAPWNDGDFYKFLEATASLWALEPEPRLAQVLDESIDVIAAAQRSDGYIHTP